MDECPGLLAWVGGLLIAWKIYGTSQKKDPLSDKSPTLFHLSSSKLFFDEMYSFYVNRVQDPFFRFLEVMELLFIWANGQRGSRSCCFVCPSGKSFIRGKFVVIPFGLYWHTRIFAHYGGGNS